MRAAVVATLACLAAAGCGGGSATTTPTAARTTSAPAIPDTQKITSLERASCPAALGGYRCATLTVPLARRGEAGGDLRLAVATQDVPRPKGDFVLLTGGPGQPGLSFGPRMARVLRTVAKGYRLVLLDQRGTGATAIDCPALQRSVGTSDLAVPAPGAVKACAAQLGDARGVYSTADTVADLDTLREILGDRTWTIGGISYGTLVAERYALAHPAATKAVVLDSVVPQGGAELLERVPLRATARVLGTKATMSLRRVLARDPALGPRLFDAITERTIGVPRLAPITAALRRAAAGDRAPLDALLRADAEGPVPPALFSSGLHAATLCADAPPLRSTRLTPSETAPWPTSTALRQGLYVTCRQWPRDRDRPPAPTGTIRAPALLLSGDHDLSTPTEWARAQARAMPHASLVVVRGAGHSIISRATNPSGLLALQRFLAR